MVPWGPVGLSQTSPIPRSPDGDKNEQINLIFLLRDCCQLIIKTMTLQWLKPARSGNQDNFFKKNSLALKSYRLLSNNDNHEKILGNYVMKVALQELIIEMS